MKGSNGTVNMAGEKMNVLVSEDCLTGCKPFIAARLPLILPHLCKTLSMRSVARYFIRDIRIGEALYSYPLCEEYLDIVNKAIQTHPQTKLGAGGLLEYVACGDDVMDFYLQNQIVYIQPSLKVVDGDLLCMTEIGCKGELTYFALQALLDILTRQFHYYWGQNAEHIEIPLPGSVLTFVDGIAHFGRKEDIERKTGEKAEILKNPAVCIRLYHDDFRGFDIAADQ